MHLSSYKVIEGRLRLILGLLSSFRVMCPMERMDGMGWDGYHRSEVLNNDCPTKGSSTVILKVKMADFAYFGTLGPFL